MKFQSKMIREQIGYSLGSFNKTEFTSLDLKSVREITLSPVDSVGEYCEYDINEINLLSNLEKIEIINDNITADKIKVIKSFKHLSKITFERCVIEDENLLYDFNLKEFNIINSNIKTNDFIYNMNNLQKLSVVNMSINLGLLKCNSSLEDLNLAYSIVVNTYYADFPNLQKLSLEHSNVKELDWVLKFEKLERLSLSMEQYQENTSVVKKLISKGVKIYRENIFPFDDMNSD